jgi:hypothetical protein
VEPKAPDNVPAVVPPAEPATIASTLVEPAASASTPAEPEKIAALKREDLSPVEAAKPKIPVAETSPPSESAPAQADAPAPTNAPDPADETRIAAIEPVLSPANEAVPAASEKSSAPAAPDADIASTEITKLGGPSVTIETPPPAKAASAKPDRSAIKKRLQARRAAHRRKMALRARATRQAPQQPAADPFSQPTITVRNP